jgi:hypothetical protein
MRECFGEISPRPLPSTLRSITPTRFPRRMEQLVDPKTVTMRRATEDGLGEGGSSADGLIGRTMTAVQGFNARSGAATSPFSCVSYKIKIVEQAEARSLFRTVPCTLQNHETHNTATQPKGMNSNDIQKERLSNPSRNLKKYSRLMGDSSLRQCPSKKTT